MSDLAYPDTWCFIVSHCNTQGHDTGRLVSILLACHGWYLLRVIPGGTLYQKATTGTENLAEVLPSVSDSVHSSLLNWWMSICFPVLSLGLVNIMQKFLSLLYYRRVSFICFRLIRYIQRHGISIINRFSYSKKWDEKGIAYLDFFYYLSLSTLPIQQPAHTYCLNQNAQPITMFIY